MFKDSNEVPPSDDWFLYEYIDAEVQMKVDKTKGQLAGDEMEKETKHYMEYFNQNTNWLKMITIEINKYLIDCEYIDFFIQINMQLSTDDGYNSSCRTFIIPRLPRFEKLALSQFKLYIETQTITQCFV